VDRDRRAAAGLVHPVDVRRVEVEARPRPVAAPPRRAADREPLLDQLALHDGHRSTREIVVVKARVVTVHPRDHPHVEVVVATELRVVAMLDVQVHERAPRRPVGGDLGDEPAQRREVEVTVEGEPQAHAGTSASRMSRAGFRDRRATSTASPSPGSAGCATGRSDPCARASTPSSRITASTARGPYGRGVEEDVRVGGRAPSARDQPLPLQRREAGQHGEAHPQARVRGSAEGAERVPRRVHRGHVPGERGPPRRLAADGRPERGERVGRGAGMHEQRRVALLEHLE
jgi:hypothetical protein